MTEFNRMQDWTGATGSIARGPNGEFLKSGVIKATTLRGADFKARVMPLAAAVSAAEPPPSATETPPAPPAAPPAAASSPARPSP
jgi:hypothetical protein